MIYLILSIVSSALISICMRVSEKHIRNQMGMFMANYATCILLSFLFIEEKAGYLTKNMSLPVVGMGLACGILYLVNFIFLKFNMKHNGIVLATTFMKLGVLIPTLMAVVVFHETPGWTQVVGIGLSIVAIIIIHFEKDAIQEGNKKIWLLLLLMLSGITDSMANIFEQAGAAEAKDGYLFVTFFAAFLIALVLALVSKTKMSGKDILFGILLGIPNYFSARFLLQALGSVKAVLAYPMYSVGTIVIIMLAGVILFRESISKKKACALGLIVLALCLLNI